uniref:Mitoferrin-1 n=2 Tax=Ascaris TaxID=6251 RepID=A0A0M3I5V5_ASCLU
MDEGEYESLRTHRVWVHLSAGSLAGLTEHCVMFPFDLIKTRLQSLCPCPEMQCPSAMHGLASVVKREGWLRPLRGINAMAVGSAPAHAVYFTVYEKTKEFLTSNTNGIFNGFSYAISGALATLFHDAVMNPAEVVKQRMQMVYSPYGNSLECARCIYQREGISAFYRSYTTQLFMNVPYQCLHFVTYEFMQDLLNREHKYNPISHLISGGIAGGFAAALTTPLDCIKTVLNTQQTPEINRDCHVLLKSTIPEVSYTSYRGIMDAVRTIHFLRGSMGFFRGIQARVIYQVPSTALSWSVYELFKYILSLQEGKLNIR